MAAWTGPKDKLQWEDLRRKVGDPLEEHEGEGDGRKMLEGWYDLIYRGESMLTSHAGVGAICRFGTVGADYDAIQLPGDTFDVGAVRAQLCAATMLSFVGARVFARFGYSTVKLDALTTEFTKGLVPENLLPDATP